MPHYQWVHADRHGALVIPAEVIPDLKASIETLLETEMIILGPAQKAGFNFDKLEAASGYECFIVTCSSIET